MRLTLEPRPTPEKPKLRSLCADNPSPMTGTGTMTYLLGSGEVVVIDPGPDLPAHAERILSALEPGERIVALLATHAHADHVGGMARLGAMTGAKSWGFGPAGAGRSAGMQALVAAGLPDGGEGFEPGYAPDHLVADGQELRLGSVTLTALHTPGHTGCSMCFAAGEVLFTGDLAMGWASSLIAPPDGDMTAYLASLRRLSARRWTRLLPGHGPEVMDPAGRLAELIAHRLTREAEVKAALAEGLTDILALTAAIYSGTPAALHPAAMRNLLAHLIALWQRGEVLADPLPVLDAEFRLA